jgi:hypothetical protein
MGLLQSGVSRLGEWILKTPAAVDTIAALAAVNFICGELNKQQEQITSRELERSIRGW